MKPLPGFNGILLYLDYDGCLHNWACHFGIYDGTKFRYPEGFKLFEYMGLLEELLHPYPEVKIILIQELTPGLRQRVIGTVLHRGTNSKITYGTKIGHLAGIDIKKRKPKDWFALCGNLDGWSSDFAEKVIVTHHELGVSHPKVKQLIRERLAFICREKHSDFATTHTNTNLIQTLVVREQLRHYRNCIVVVKILREFIVDKARGKEESLLNDHLSRALLTINSGNLTPDEIIWCVNQISGTNRFGHKV